MTVNQKDQKAQRREAVPGAQALDFKRARRGRANRGEISQIAPHTRSGESVASFSRRSSKRNLTKNVERSVFIKRVLAVIAIIAAVVVVLYNVATCAYNSSVGGRMQIQDEAVSNVLVTPESDQDPYYVLVAGCYWSSESVNQGADMLMLARLDQANGKVTLISIPGNLVYNTGRIGESQVTGGDAALIENVAAFAGVSIAHYIKVNSPGFVSLIDKMGGIQVNVEHEVDDPDAGCIYIPAGDQLLSGEQSLTYLRANNYSGGDSDRMGCQLNFMKAFVSKLLEKPDVALMDQLSDCIQTDYSTEAALSALQAFSGVNPADFTVCQVPGATYEENGKENFYMKSSEWVTLMQSVDAGSDPSQKESVLENVKASDFSVEIRNGGGVTGAGSEAKSLLDAAGFKTGKPTNTDSAAYDETLVIYKKDKNAQAAEAVLEALGTGRVVQNSVYYTFSKDVLVIVGKDWNYSG